MAATKARTKTSTTAAPAKRRGRPPKKSTETTAKPPAKRRGRPPQKAVQLPEPDDMIDDDGDDMIVDDDDDDDDDGDGFVQVIEARNDQELTREELLAGIDDESTMQNQTASSVMSKRAQGEKGIAWRGQHHLKYNVIAANCVTQFGGESEVEIIQVSPKHAHIGIYPLSQISNWQLVDNMLRSNHWDGTAQRFKITIMSTGRTVAAVCYMMFQESLHRQAEFQRMIRNLGGQVQQPQQQPQPQQHGMMGQPQPQQPQPQQNGMMGQPQPQQHRPQYGQPPMGSPMDPSAQQQPPQQPQFGGPFSAQQPAQQQPQFGEQQSPQQQQQWDQFQPQPQPQQPQPQPQGGPMGMPGMGGMMPGMPGMGGMMPGMPGMGGMMPGMGGSMGMGQQTPWPGPNGGMPPSQQGPWGHQSPMLPEDPDDEDEDDDDDDEPDMFSAPAIAAAPMPDPRIAVMEKMVKKMERQLRRAHTNSQQNAWSASAQQQQQMQMYMWHMSQELGKMQLQLSDAKKSEAAAKQQAYAQAQAQAAQVQAASATEHMTYEQISALVAEQVRAQREADAAERAAQEQTQPLMNPTPFVPGMMPQAAQPFVPGMMPGMMSQPSPTQPVQPPDPLSDMERTVDSFARMQKMISRMSPQAPAQGPVQQPQPPPWMNMMNPQAPAAEKADDSPLKVMDMGPFRYVTDQKGKPVDFFTMMALNADNVKGWVEPGLRALQELRQEVQDANKRQAANENMQMFQDMSRQLAANQQIQSQQIEALNMRLAPQPETVHAMQTGQVEQPQVLSPEQSPPISAQVVDEQPGPQAEPAVPSMKSPPKGLLDGLAYAQQALENSTGPSK